MKRILSGFLFLIILCIAQHANSETQATKQFPSLANTQEIPCGIKDVRQQKLTQTLKDYLKNHWEIEEARYFIASEKPTRDAVRKFVGNTLHDQGRTKPIDIEWRRPGLDLTAIFKHGSTRQQIIAVSMLPEPVEGQWVLGYFSLKK